MALVGVSITKSVAFRESAQEFSNVYHYFFSGGDLTETQAEALIDRLVTLEKQWHSNVVTFVHGRCWTSGGGEAANNMIKEKALSGAGSGSTTASFDKERAWLVQWDGGFDSRGKPVKFRKWFHTCGAFGANSASSSNLTNDASLSSTIRGNVATAVNALNPLTVSGIGSNGIMCNKGNSRAADTGAVCHRFLEHRQLGDQWR
jgi:hypothetical protein